MPIRLQDTSTGLLLHASLPAIGLAEKSQRMALAGRPDHARLELRKTIDAPGEAAKTSALTARNGEDLSKLLAKCP
jgi:hypothetical protein